MEDCTTYQGQPTEITDYCEENNSIDFVMDTGMTQMHCEALCKFRIQFVKDLNPDDVLDHLIAARIITPDDQEEIAVQKTRKDKVRFILDLLPRRSDKAFYSLKEALKDADSGHHHLYQLLNEKLDDISLPTPIQATESEGSLQYGSLHRTDSFDSPDSSSPRTQPRSRSSSTKRSHSKQRKVSCSPKRMRTGEQGLLKRKRSQSRERPQEEKAVRMQPGARHAGEDQPDHAVMPLEVDIPDDNMATGDAIAPQVGDKTTSAEQRPLLRNYQLELAEDAVKGKNTVLVAPTGSGKTHVAAYIIHDHFIRKQSKPIQERCALFLVNTVNLVDQQENKLSELLLPKDFFSITGLSGASEFSLQHVVTSRNVIVLTAQILENALNDDSNKITLDRFSLLVFDECHLCQKNHAYNAIMAHYLDGKQNGKANLPQIIGMTASLGTGKAKNQEQADQHTIQICANMDAQSIMVTRHTEELKYHVNNPIEVEPIEVNSRQVDPFADKIKKVMEKVEKLLLESPTDAIHEQMRNEKIPTEKGSQAYRQWCDRIRKNAQKIITQDTDDYRILVICSKHLMAYNSALLINKQVRSKDAYKYLKQMIDKEKDRMACFEDTGHKLMKIFFGEKSNLETIKDDPNNENPLLKKLSEIILEEYRLCPQSRAILFVKTIDTTQALQDWIQDTPKLQFLNPGRIAGSRDMKSKEQNKVIKDFRNGEHHMLVATNLLEQGTDVPACNLVIRLDYVPSDSGHIQIKGRTRAKNGRSNLISPNDSNATARNEVNRQRESMMKKAALNLNAKSETEFLKLVESQQESDKGDREARKMQKREIMQDNKGKVFSFHCEDCGKLVVKSNQIGVYQDMYIVLDSVISGKMKKKAHPKPKKLDQDRTIIAKIFCYRCEQVFGSLTQVKNVYYPCIKITRFSLVRENSDDKTGKTYVNWTAANLDITELKHLPKDAAVKVSKDLLREI